MRKPAFGIFCGLCILTSFSLLTVNVWGVSNKHCLLPFFHLGLIFPFNYTFYSRNNTGWIANKEIDLDPNNSVINWLWCICKYM